MRSHVYIKYDEKFKTVGDTAALDLKKTMRDWLPKCKRRQLAAEEVNGADGF